MGKQSQKVKIDFIGIGAVKSGTTWLVSNLSKHPRIFIPDRKEVFFFSNEEHGGFYSKGTEWYAHIFSKADDKLRGEFTTHYMYYPECAGLIKDNSPDAKIIAILRNPINMIYSYYWWRKSNIGIAELPETFEEALEADKEYINRGKYYDQIKRYTDIFPREQIKVIIFDDIVNQADKVISDVLEFIGLPGNWHPKGTAFPVNTASKVRFQYISRALGMIYNTINKLGLESFAKELLSEPHLTALYRKLNKKPFNYPPMQKKTREHLKSILIPDIEKLEKLLSIDLSIWKV